MIARSGIELIRWVGPFSISELLNHSTDGSIPLPPESDSAYLITRKSWRDSPSHSCGPLYVGGNTGQSARFRTRIGDLLADMFGFFGEETGHHSGGQSLNRWCREKGISPMDLHIAWAKHTRCHRCLEINLVRELSPELNKHAPARCRIHDDR